MMLPALALAGRLDFMPGRKATIHVAGGMKPRPGPDDCAVLTMAEDARAHVRPAGVVVFRTPERSHPIERPVAVAGQTVERLDGLRFVDATEVPEMPEPGHTPRPEREDRYGAFPPCPTLTPFCRIDRSRERLPSGAEPGGPWSTSRDAGPSTVGTGHVDRLGDITLSATCAPDGHGPGPVALADVERVRARSHPAPR